MRFKKNTLALQKKSMDLPILLTVACLVLFGLVMVYDVSAVHAMKDFSDANYYIRLQLIWVVLGVASAFFFSRFDYHFFAKIPLLMFVVSFLLLLSVFIPGLGISGGGAHRWISLGFVTIQPAEIVKLTGVIYLAALFEKGARFIPFAVLCSLVTLVTAILQKDLGSSIVFVLTAAAMYFARGGKIIYFLSTIPVGILSLIGLIMTSPYRQKRVLAFLDPFSDTQGFTYHISQVLIALGSGGLFGVGLGKSRQKFEYIPEVTTDSIFAVIGEELGFIGGVILIGLFATLAVRGFKIAERASDNFGKNLAVGITSLLTIQAIVNLSSMVALLPLTGVPLPFISYGGSALVANLTAIGILLNISRRSS